MIHPWKGITESGRQRNLNMARSMGKTKTRCPKCTRMIAESQMGRHQQACNALQHVPVGHGTCACGRIKRRDARCCFRCGGDFGRVLLACVAGRRRITIAEIEELGVSLEVAAKIKQGMEAFYARFDRKSPAVQNSVPEWPTN